MFSLGAQLLNVFLDYLESNKVDVFVLNNYSIRSKLSQLLSEE